MTRFDLTDFPLGCLCATDFPLRYGVRVSVASSLLHSYIPSPDQGVWYLGPIPIRAYALFIIVGIILAVWWGDRRWKARGGEPGTIVDIALFAVPFGLVGGRLYHVCTDYWRYFGEGRNPLDALRIWDGGLGIPGAIFLGGVGAWIACRRKKIPLPAVADTIAPGIVTAQAIGRLGNYFNQELYGGPTTLPWGLEIFRRANPATGRLDDLNGVAVSHADPQIVHPTFLYELIWDLIVAGLVVWAARRFALGHGRAFALYVGGYAFGRFWIELLREDPATHIFGARINVWVMGLLFIGAVVYIVLARRCGPVEDIAALTSTADGPPGTKPESAEGEWRAEEPTAAEGAVGSQSKSGTSR